MRALSALSRHARRDDGASATGACGTTLPRPRDFAGRPAPDPKYGHADGPPERANPLRRQAISCRFRRISLIVTSRTRPACPVLVHARGGFEMTRAPLVLAIFLIGVSAASTVAAREADQAQTAATSVASAEDRGDAPVVSASLRLALSFWLPVYYGMFVWLLTSGEGRGGAPRPLP